MKTRQGIIILGALAVLACGCSKQGGDASAVDPRFTATSQVFDGFFAAMSSSDFVQASSFFHPDELAAFEDALWPIVEMGAADSTRREVLQIFNFNFDVQNGVVVKPRPDSFFSAFMESMSQKIPNFKEALASTKGQVIGGVAEGDSLFHLVYRASAQAMGSEIRAVETASFKQAGGDWKILMTGELKGLAEGIRRTLMPEQG